MDPFHQSGTGQDRVQQIAWALGVSQDLFRQAHTQGTLEAQQEFHASQAVETEIAFQRAIEGDGQGMVFMGVELKRELLHDVEQRLSGRVERAVVRLWLS